MPVLWLWCQQGSSTVHLLFRGSLFLLPSLHAFVKSLMTPGAAVPMCSLASSQEGLPQLVHTWQINTWAPCSIAWTCRLCLERDVLCLCSAAAMGRAIGSGTLQLQCDGLGALQRWLCLNFFSCMSHTGSPCSCTTTMPWAGALLAFALPCETHPDLERWSGLCSGAGYASLHHA